MPGLGDEPGPRQRLRRPARNPLAVEALPTDVVASAVGMALFLGAFVASVAALVVRFRRSHGVERQQLKWFVSSLSRAPAWCCRLVCGVLVRHLGRPGAAAVALTAIPVVASVAILRYRLYDIDLIVDRTLVYAAVHSSLAAAYG